MKDLENLLSKKKVIVFDLDGTIVRLNVNWKNLRNLLSQTFYQLYGERKDFKTITECFNEIIERDDESQLEAFFKLVQDFELRNIENTELIEETIYFINNLEHFGITKQVFLAILSLNMQVTIKKTLTLANLSGKFSYIVGKENVRNWKPHPSGLLKIKDYFGVTREKMIYFGDLKKDVETGMNAGIDAFLIEQLIALVKEKYSSI